MRNFIIFFQEKEGSSPIIRLLDQHPAISVIRTIAKGVGGWEPFDTYNAGAIRLDDLLFCLDGLLGTDEPDLVAVNARYGLTARGPLKEVDPDTSLGFKMRFKSPADWPGLKARHRLRKRTWFRFLSFVFKKLHYPRFRKRMLAFVAQQDLVVFVLVRQDIFRWALSRYHGDGTGRRGHLQFGLAMGKITREDIAKINVSPGRLKRLIRACQQAHGNKRRLIRSLEKRGVEVYPIFYEDFMQDNVRFFRQFLERIEVDSSDEEIATMLSQGTVLKKVHADDISTFVVNHAEIMRGFGHVYSPWDESFAYQDVD